MTWSIGPGWTTTYNPFGSVSLNGTTQSLNTTAINLTNVSVFTVEAWINLSTATGAQQTVVTTRTFGAETGWELRVNSTRTVEFYFTAVAATNLISTTVLALNTWYHVAVVRNGSAATLYINGAPADTASAFANGTAGGGTFIGMQSPNNNRFAGNITNLRIVSGVAVYTSAFNVPRAPLRGIQPASSINISAITGTQTQLLLQTPNNASFLVDSSANNYTITNNGTATAAALTPFVNGGGAGWKLAGPENGSASFNGSTQYLTRANNALFNFGAGAFTVEAWVYLDTSVTTQQCIVTNYGSSTTGWSLQVENGKIIANLSGDGNDITGTTALSINQWYHVAISGATGSIKMFVNGNLDGTYTGATSLDSAGVLSIGRIATIGYLNGYISNLRIVKGVAVYTDAFTPPIRQLPAVQDANVYGLPSAAVTGTQTSLLLNTPNNSQNIQDSSTNNFTITNTGSTPPSGINPFVPDLGAVSFNGTSQWLNAGAAANWTFLSNGLVDWTVEGWVYFTSTPAVAGTQTLCSTNIQTANVGFGIQLRATDISLQIVRGTSGTYAMLGTSSTVTWAAGTWYHVAVTYTSATATANYYLNGVSYGSSTATASRSASAPTNTLQVGRNPTSTFTYMTGYMTNLRIVNGVLVYTGAFTPPAQPLPATQAANAYGSPSAAITGTQTSLLLNTPNNAQFIADSSSNGFTLTNNGTAVATSLTPFSS